ncbi:hypothetical protein TNCV_5038341 [Trichonephila clavipes]|nr:hypothetical protein TNCV_5038341 [Trichonephila clavipes]
MNTGVKRSNSTNKRTTEVTEAIGSTTLYTNRQACLLWIRAHSTFDLTDWSRIDHSDKFLLLFSPDEQQRHVRRHLGRQWDTFRTVLDMQIIYSAFRM